MAEVKDLIVYGSSNLIGESFSDIIHSNSFKTNGGTPSQFVKGDGSLDPNVYITASDVPTYSEGNGIDISPVTGGYQVSVDINSNSSSYLSASSSGLAFDSSLLVHLANEERITGIKTFTAHEVNIGSGETGAFTALKFPKMISGSDYGPYISGSYNTTVNKPYLLFEGSHEDEAVLLSNVDDPVGDYDAVNKHYLNSQGFVGANDLATVATSGLYSDLSGTPTIPTVNNATLTIKQGGATKGTFTANASQNVEINLDAGGGGSAGTLDTTNTTALTPSASESLGGSVNLHKVSKTGTYSDLNGTPTYALGETTGGPASLTVGLPYGTIDATSTGTLMTATVNGITELRDGVTCIIVNNVVGSASGYTLNVNSLGAKPVYYFYDDTTQSSTSFTVGKTVMFVYDSTKVSGGCWNMMYPFSPDQTSDTYRIRHYYSTKPLATALGQYRILFSSADGTKYVPATSSTSTSATTSKTVTTEKIDPFGEILVYNSTTTRTANQTPSASVLFSQMRITIGYSFNRTGAASTLTTNVPVYIKCTPQTDGSAIIDPDTPYVQSMPSTEDGKIYIFLGIASSATYVEVLYTHPVYQYKGGKIIQYLPSDSNLVHKTGAEAIAGIKTFNDDVNIVDSSLVIDTNDQNKHNVYINLDNYHDDGGDGIAVLALDDPSGEGNVIIRDVASPISSNDAANKQYVDTLHRYNSVILNGLSGAYGIHEKSLCACANWANDTMGLMSSFTTVGGTHTSKSTDIGVTFPIGCKIYYHPDDTAFTNNTSFTGKKFYSTYDSVDARYTAVEGYNVSLSNGGASNVYLKVQVVFANATTRWTPFYDKTTVSEIIITSDDLESDNFYIYLGKTNASNAYQFQLEENNPLYYYDGTHLINWASYIADFYGGSTYTAGNGIRIDSNNVISTRVDHPSVTTSSIALDAGKEYSFEGSAFTLITVSFNLIADGLNLFHFNIPPQNSDFNLSLTMPSGVTLSLPPGYSLQNSYIPLSSNIMYEFSIMMTNSKARVLIARWY